MENLPQDTLSLILSYCRPDDVYSILQSCKSLNRFSKDEQFWKQNSVNHHEHFIHFKIAQEPWKQFYIWISSTRKKIPEGELKSEKVTLYKLAHILRQSKMILKLCSELVGILDKSSPQFE
jgi:hypothetical protein